MGSSLPKLPSVGHPDGRDAKADSSELRRARRIGPGLQQSPTRPNQESVVQQRPRERETPTLTSLETVKIAEEETRLAKSRNHPGSGISSSSDRLAAVRELYASGQVDEALALATEVAPDGMSDDPFGGLIPVEDEVEGDDPFGGLIPVEDDEEPGLPALIPPLDLSELDEPTAIVPSTPRVVLTSRRVPRLLVDPREIAKLPIDPRAAFIVGHVDGIQTMEEILDVCAMPESEAIELIERLCSMDVLKLE